MVYSIFTKRNEKSLFNKFIYTSHRCEVIPLTPEQLTEIDDFMQNEQTGKKKKKVTRYSP